MSLATTGTAAVLLISAVLCFLRLRQTRRYPPVPAGWPIIGNLHLLPDERSWEYAFDASKKHGDLVYFHIPGASLLFLNSYEAASDLLDSRGSIYSDRPRSQMIELMEVDLLGFDRFSPEWQLRRKVFHQHLGKGAVRQYVDTITNGAHAYAARVMQNPADFMSATQLLVTKLIMRVTYGLTIDSPESEYIKLLEDQALILGTASRPGAYAVDQLPFLQHMPSWFPGTKSVRLARGWSKDIAEGQSRLWDRSVEQMKTSKHTSSFVSEALQAAVAPESVLKGVGPTMFFGGSETSTTTLHAFILAMTLYPDVQQRAQEEIDRVVGTQRLPDLADRDRLPYVEAVFKETLRWYIAAPIAFPHRLMRDDTYRGYFIPKGTMVISNLWGISQDPRIYPSPEVFRPERFAEPLADGKLPLDPTKFAFGVGRRVCPGYEFASLSLWISIVTILSTLKISKARDEQGDEIVPEVKGLATILRFIDPFECTIEPRSSTARSLVEESVLLSS